MAADNSQLQDFVYKTIAGEIPVEDKRIPEASIEDAGKVIKVGEDGKYELGEGGGSGGIEYTDINLFDSQDLGHVNTMGELLNAIPDKSSGKTYNINLTYRAVGGLSTSANIKFTIDFVQTWTLSCNIYSAELSVGVTPYFTTSSTLAVSSIDISQTIYDFWPTSIESFILVKKMPADGKTYILKCVNGATNWVEEA